MHHLRNALWKSYPIMNVMKNVKLNNVDLIEMIAEVNVFSRAVT